MSNILQKTLYTYKGVDYPSMEAAKSAEIADIGKVETLYNKFTTESFSGKQLLEKHNLNTVGIWRVIGEGEPDYNAGPGPVLGYYNGRLYDVIHTAVMLPRFFNWGSGGSIERIEVVQLARYRGVAE
jgi:hypothetical protein